MSGIPDLNRVGQLVRAVARAELLPRFGHVGEAAKADGSVVTEADLVTQSRILEALTASDPEIAQLGEEMDSAAQAAALERSAAGVWCLDPLDGTSNYAGGFPFFAVSLAWLQRGRVQLGVVYDPVRDELYAAARGAGAWLNGRPLRVPASAVTLERSLAIIDFKRLPGPLSARLTTRPPFRSQRALGSVALEWCWLAAGRGQVYLHGAQSLWDYAAGSLVLAEAGGAGCLLDVLDGACRGDLRLGKRMAVAAANERLLADWRHWLGGRDAGIDS
jgi:myo-inositol-1(or 4)-monophosphatase